MPTGWYSVCRPGLSYWPALLIRVRATHCSARRRKPALRVPHGNRSIGLTFPLAFCALRRILLRCGSVATAALLGRFLPRLGPPAQAGSPFFREDHRELFGGSPVRPQFLDRDMRPCIGQ